jgi:lipoprotein-releasing system permease protein
MVTLIVADGMIRGITDRYLELGTGHLQVFNYGDPSMTEEARALIAGAGNFRGVWAERQGLGVIMGGSGKAGASIRATDPSFWDDEGSVRFLNVIAGERHLSSDREVLLGQELARSLGAEVGKTVYIMSVRVSRDGGSIPRTLPFTVKGIVSSGYRELDSLWCIMTWEGGSRLLDPALSYAYLMVKIDDPYGDADTAAADLRRTLGHGFGVYTWKELQRSQYSSYESTRQLLLFIMALIVIVAAVNVSSAASMLAVERQRDIAVLKAAGASPGDTGRIFLWASFLTGLSGSIAGISLGLLIGVCINPLIRGLEKLLSFFSGLFNGREVKILDPGYYLERIPVIVNGKTVLLIGIITILCSVLASWIPARRAGKTRPIEILRKF